MCEENVMKNRTVDFEAVHKTATIRGFMNTEDVDTDCPFYYFDATHQVLDRQVIYSADNTEDAEKLNDAFSEDFMVEEFLYDFASENVTIERDGYTLIINGGALMEAEVQRADKEFDQGGYEAFYGTIQFKFNGEPLKLDDDLKQVLLSELETAWDPICHHHGEIRHEAYCIEFPKSFWKEEPGYTNNEKEEILNHYISIAQNIYVRQLSRDAGIYADYGENIEEFVEDAFCDDEDLYELQKAIEEDTVKELLIDRGILGE